MLDRLHDADSAAELLGVRPSTIRWWWTIGKLRRVKIGRLTRVRESELLALIKPEDIRTATHRSAQGAATHRAAPTPPKEPPK
jgi:excisionase family DNA binding protein